MVDLKVLFQSFEVRMIDKDFDVWANLQLELRLNLLLERDEAYFSCLD